jgi:integrase
MALIFDATKANVRKLDTAEHTLNHRDCPACRQALELKSLEKIMSSLCLAQAAEIVLRQKISKRLKPKSLESTQGQISALLKFFGDIPLNEIHAGSLVAYQEWRLNTACESTINHELALLKKMLRKATVVANGVQSNLWEPISEYYNPLKVKPWTKPKTFTIQEEERIFTHTGADPNLELADIVFTITRNTSASGSELRHQRLKDLQLNAKPPRVEVRDGVKNEIRPRVIPLNESALQAYSRAVDRAAKLGCHRPEHYLFPFRVNRKLYDPNRPASRSWLRKQVTKLRTASGVPHLKPHGFRHLFVTEALENGTPEETVVALAGWVSRNMINTYSHTRIEAKYAAVKTLDKKAIAREEPRKTNLVFFPQK